MSLGGAPAQTLPTPPAVAPSPAPLPDSGDVLARKRKQRRVTLVPAATASILTEAAAGKPDTLG